MGTEVQSVVCAFVREIISARSGEKIEVTERPELNHRSTPVVEELWESPSRRYAVEHTRLESYEGQIENEARLRRLVVPVRATLEGVLPGTYTLTVLVWETKGARIRYADAHHEIARPALQAAPRLEDGQTVVLRSETLPFSVQLHRRHGNGSRAFVHCLIEGDGDTLRFEQVRRALNDKCSKLAAWAGDERISVLVLEANDIQLSNVFVVYQAFKQALAERTDQPDIVVFVETDGSPMYGWVFKEGAHVGDGVADAERSSLLHGGPGSVRSTVPVLYLDPWF